MKSSKYKLIVTTIIGICLFYTSFCYAEYSMATCTANNHQYHFVCCNNIPYWNTSIWVNRSAGVAPQAACQSASKNSSYRQVCEKYEYVYQHYTQNMTTYCQKTLQGQIEFH